MTSKKGAGAKAKSKRQRKPSLAMALHVDEIIKDSVPAKHGGARSGAGRKSLEVGWLKNLKKVGEDGIPWEFIDEQAEAGVEEKDILTVAGLPASVVEANADALAKRIREGHALHRLFVGRRINHEAVKKGRSTALMAVVKEWLKYGRAVDEAVSQFFGALQNAEEQLLRELDRLDRGAAQRREDAKRLKDLGKNAKKKEASEPGQERS